MHYVFPIPSSGKHLSPPFFSDPGLRSYVRKNSKQILGNSDRAEVAAAIGLSRDVTVNATDLAAELKIENTRVRAQLLAFVEVNLLTPGPPDAGKRWYIRRETPFWNTCLEMMEAWASEYGRSGASAPTPTNSEREDE